MNRDALHQAYFNAALQLLNWGAPVDAGNPYRTHYKRQTGFATLGGPNLLALVSEVASRALKVVWRQKWLVHRRLRPEVYGGLMQLQNTRNRPYGLPSWVFETKAAQMIFNETNAYYLPLAYSAGSPAHPAYGAGHASVAGACVTILKAWFDEGTKVAALFKAAPMTDPGEKLMIRQPSVNVGPDAPLPLYQAADMGSMSVLGELNKLASNVAMGRSMGGVHWRSDNTRSLRLGEQVATVMLKRILPTYAEKPTLSYTNFDGNHLTISPAGVTVANDQPLENFYEKFH